MSLERLAKDRMIARVSSNTQQVNEVLKVGERDLNAAKDNLREGNYDWALAIAYNSMLQASRALMLSRGYRPIGEYKHVAIVEFIKVEFSNEVSRNLAFAFNKIRRKRHRVVYEQAGITTEREASEVVELAEKFVSQVKETLKQ